VWAVTLGDADFEEEVGGCAGPLRSFLEEGGDGFEDGRGRTVTNPLVKQTV
jgi:hypothetical protein